jgi:hypothetical protein
MATRAPDFHSLITVAAIFARISPFLLHGLKGVFSQVHDARSGDGAHRLILVRQIGGECFGRA